MKESLLAGVWAGVLFCLINLIKIVHLLENILEVIK